MTTDIIERVVTRVLDREFRSRTELAKALGVDSSYVARISQKAVKLGLVDGKDWAASFRTGKSGLRGKDRNPRQERLGPTSKRVLKVLTSETAAE